MIEGAIATAESRQIRVDDLPVSLRGDYGEVLVPAFQLGDTMRAWGSRYARLVLEKNAGNKRQACKVLDISYHTLNAYLNFRPPPVAAQAAVAGQRQRGGVVGIDRLVAGSLRHFEGGEAGQVAVRSCAGLQNVGGSHGSKTGGLVVCRCACALLTGGVPATVLTSEGVEDVTPPKVIITSPADAITTRRSEITVRGRVSDRMSGISSVTVQWPASRRRPQIRAVCGVPSTWRQRRDPAGDGRGG